MRALFDDNAIDYDRDQAPVVNNQKVVVDTFMVITEVTNFDSVNEALSTMIWLDMSWTDHRIHWRPEDYGGNTQLFMNPDQIWKPDITCYNSADGLHQFSTFMGNQVYVRCNNEGFCRWTPMMRYTTTCPLHMRYFPFDTQMCTIKLGSWVHNTDRIHFNLTTKKTDTNRFAQKNTWTLIDTLQLEQIQDYTEEGDGYFQELHFILILSRNYYQYLINVVMTVGILATVTIFSFWVPTKSGTRLSLSLSIIISVSVYQLQASSLIPTGTDVVPAIVTFLAILVILINFSVVVTMVNIKLEYDVQVDSPPKCILNACIAENFIGKALSKVLRVKSSYIYEVYEDTKEKMETGKLDMTNPDEAHQLVDAEWDLVAMVMDRICMTTYGIIFLAMIIFLFAHIPTVPRQIDMYVDDLNDRYNGTSDGVAQYNCHRSSAVTRTLDPENERPMIICDETNPLQRLQSTLGGAIDSLLA